VLQDTGCGAEPGAFWAGSAPANAACEVLLAGQEAAGPSEAEALEDAVNASLVVGAVIAAACILYWIPIRGWYRRSEARRLGPTRAMSGDADVIAPDTDSTLTITINAAPADVWPRLLEMGRGSTSLLQAKPASDLGPGDVLRFRFAPAFPIQAIDAGRTLVLGDGPGLLQWRWQFEVYAVDTTRTRLISRTRIRSGRSASAKLTALALRPIAFVLTRKMLLDVKRRAERGGSGGETTLRATV
jgi:hypothetical protein